MENTKTTDTIKQINTLRKTNKGSWYYFNGQNPHGATVQLKAYGTSIQILNVGGFSFGGLWDLKVKEFNAVLEKALNFNPKGV